MSDETNFLDPKEVKRLSQLTPSRTLVALVADWVVVAAAVAVSEWSGSWLVWLIAVPVIAGRMHAFSGLIHDFSHYRFISNKAVSDWIGDLFLAWPLLATIEGYRRNHLAHHRYTNTGKDPDWVIKLGRREFTFPQEMRFAILNLAGYFVGVSSMRDMRLALKRLQADDPFSRSYKLLRLVYYMSIITAVTLLGVWREFLLYWAVPYFTVFFFLLYIRSAAEHFGETMDYTNEFTGTRTVKPYFWERWIFCPHNLNHHLEHHLYPSVPYYRLPELAAALERNANYAGTAHLTRGYVTGLVRELWLDGWQKRRDRKAAGLQPAKAEPVKHAGNY